MELNCFIRTLRQKEIVEALCLTWSVFRQYEAPDYTQEGVEEFYKSIHDEKYLSELCWYGAFIQKNLVGVIATRNAGTHIALFFVQGRYHRQGIGKQLYQAARAANHSNVMTVNSSPYAVPIYHKLGFKNTGSEQVVNGLRFTPMELNQEDDMDIWEKLYQRAEKEYHPEDVSPFIQAHHVVCALESEDGTIYTGFCIEACSSVMNLCAERVAALNMYVSSGQTRIKRLIAFRDRAPFGGGSGMPCGACREFLYQLNEENENTEIMVNYKSRKTVTLRELMPDFWGKERYFKSHPI